MGTAIFLGMPPANIRQWIIDHPPTPAEEPDPVDSSAWGQVVAALENCTPDQFNGDTLAYTGSDATLTAFALGSGVSDLKYKVYSANDPVNTTWINMGFNATVPEYVKYRRTVGSGFKHVWVKSMKSGLLAPIAVGDAVYTRTYDAAAYDNTYTAVDGETVTAVAGEFKYGNNYKTGDGAYDARFAVPTSITTAKGTYDFCGYNFCLNAQAILNVEGQNTLLWSGDPDAWEGTNDWSQAKFRAWLNTAGTVDGMRFNGESGAAYTGLYSRLLANDGFMKNIAKAVNRTWVYGDFRSGKTLDANSCEHIADKFWTLGNGNVNCTNTEYYGTTFFYDNLYDTFRCSLITEDQVYQPNDSRIRFTMNTDGTTSSSAGYWWLRSASADDGMDAGCVYGDGRVYYYVVCNDFFSGALPACLIG